MRAHGSAVFGARFGLTNCSGTRFEVEVERSVRRPDARAVWQALGVPEAKGVSLVAFATDNRIKRLSGPRAALDAIARATLGVSLEEIESVFDPR